MVEEYIPVLKNILVILIKYGFPTFAITLSFLSYWNSRKSQKIKERLLRVEEKLKQYELAEKEKLFAENSLSCIGARIVKFGKNYRLKIWNSGKATAHNVDFELLENIDNLIIKDKAPFEFLESGKNFEEFVIVHNGTPSKVKIKTKWDNKEGNKFSKNQIIQVY